jgi:hypothetical protein
MNIRTYIQLGVIFALIGGLTYVINSFGIYKKSNIDKMESKIKKDSVRIAKLDSTVYSLQQTVDMKQRTDEEFQSVIKGLNDENKELKRKINTNKILTEKIEANGNVRYFEKMIFQSCFRETFKKPSCIKE